MDDSQKGRAIGRCRPFLRSAGAVVLLLSTIVASGSDGGSAPFYRKNYPPIDLRLLDWPIAERTAPTPERPFVEVECYTQLDRSFVSTDALVRLNNSLQLRHRACMLRVPTATRLTVHDMHTTNRKTYATVLAGSLQVYMPLKTAYIHQGQKENYGPWHIPCQQAYLVFNARGAGIEWVEFRLDDETEADRELSDPKDCVTEVLVNYVDKEYREKH
uniref:Uncharacterized protein n=1 Tax=Globodera rostochiensis TaxID=31243 RepID=A0A914HQZ4_GLORO